MTTDEAARSLGIARRTVQIQIERGKLRAERHGHAYWIRPAEVERYRRASLGKRAGKGSAE